MEGSGRMKHLKSDQVDFIKANIYKYQKLVDEEKDKDKKWILNDIIDMYYSILELYEEKK